MTFFPLIRSMYSSDILIQESRCINPSLRPRAPSRYAIISDAFCEFVQLARFFTSSYESRRRYSMIVSVMSLSNIFIFTSMSLSGTLGKSRRLYLPISIVNSRCRLSTSFVKILFLLESRSFSCNRELF